MSDIVSIYAALAAKNITIQSTTPTVYSLANLPANIESAITPCRLLLPMGNNPAQGIDGNFIAIGTSVTVTWQIADLFIWKQSGQGIGLKEAAPIQVEYAGLYVDMLRTFRAPATQSSLENFQVTPGMYEYPSGSGLWFYGVMCTLSILEVIGG